MYLVGTSSVVHRPPGEGPDHHPPPAAMHQNTQSHFCRRAKHRQLQQQLLAMASWKRMAAAGVCNREKGQAGCLAACNGGAMTVHLPACPPSAAAVAPLLPGNSTCSRLLSRVGCLLVRVPLANVQMACRRQGPVLDGTFLAAPAEGKARGSPAGCWPRTLVQGTRAGSARHSQHE
jgi:hypothetical protein